MTVSECKYFKKYKGIYPPKCGCNSCWSLYNKNKLNNSTNLKLKGNKNDQNYIGSTWFH